MPPDNPLTSPMIPSSGATNSLTAPLQPGATNSLTSALAQAHQSASAMFDQTAQATSNIATVNSALERLSKLGDLVKDEDVVEEAGKLVATGTHSPVEMATLLSEMPQGSPAIANWIQQLYQQSTANMEKVAQLHNIARHEMGSSGLRLLANVSGESPSPPTPGPGSSAPSGAGNSLMTGSP